MATRVRKATHAQGSRQIVRYQQELTGGLNVDENPGTLPTGSFPELTNLRVSGSRLVALQGELATLPAPAADRIIAVANRGWAKAIQGDYLWEVSSDDEGVTWKFWWYGRSPRYGTYAWLGGNVLPMTEDATYDQIWAIPYLSGVMIAGGGRLTYAVSKVYDSGLGYNLWGFDYVVMNAEAPIAPALPPMDPDTAIYDTAPAGGVDSIDRLYYLLFTIATLDDAGTVLWESLPLAVTDSAGNLKTVTFSGTIGEASEWTGGAVFLNALKMTIDGNLGTHFRVYRTLDVGAVAVAETDFDNASAQSYRLIVQREIPPVGYTSIDFNTDADAMLYSDADILLFNPEVYAGLLRAPMPVGTMGVLAYSDGYLWTAEDEVAYHSEAAAYPRFAGCYFTGSASPVVEHNPITGIFASDGYALVCTPTTVRRVSTQNVLEFGTSVGIYGTVFQYTPYVTQDYGIWHDRSRACDGVGSEVILFCSDSQVRIYSGSAMGEPVSGGKVSKILRTVTGPCVSAYSPEGWWQVGWSSTGSGAADTALRLSLSEQGRPWCKVVWDADNCKPFYLPSAFFSTGEGAGWSGVLRATVDADGDAHWSLYSETSFSDTVKDLPFAISSPNYGGEYDGYLVRHEETTLTVNGTFSAGTFAIVADSAADEPFGQRRAYSEQIALAGDQVEAPLSIVRTIQNIRHAQVRLTGSDTTRFELTKLMSILSAQDRPYRNRTVLALAPGNADRMRMTPCSGLLASQESFAEATGGTVTGTISALLTAFTPPMGPLFSNVQMIPGLQGYATAQYPGSYATLGTGLTQAADEPWSLLVGTWLYAPNLCTLESSDPDNAYYSLFAIGDFATVRVFGYDDSLVDGDVGMNYQIVANATGAVIQSGGFIVDDTASSFVRIEALFSNDGDGGATDCLIGHALSPVSDTATIAWVDAGLTPDLGTAFPAPASVVAFGGFARWKSGVLVPAEKGKANFICWDTRVGSTDEATSAGSFRNTGYLSDFRNNRGEIYCPGIILR